MTRSPSTKLLLILAIALATSTSLAQTGIPPATTSTAVQPTPAHSLTFDVATIKPNRAGGLVMIRPLVDGIRATNVTLLNLIQNAYEDNRVTGLPAWGEIDKFDVQAKVDGAQAELLRRLNPDQQEHALDSMLQALLADRFRLAVHMEAKEAPAYALVVLKSGARLKEGKSEALTFPMARCA